MKFTKTIVLLLLIGLSCSAEPERINYGNDSCHSCKMTIVNKLYAAQLVTTKGRNYKYDALECMLNDLKNWDSNQVGLILVTDYETPSHLVDATHATFLVSQQIKSPMGGNLASFNDRSKALNFAEANSGELFSWTEILTRF